MSYSLLFVPSQKYRSMGTMGVAWSAGDVMGAKTPIKISNLSQHS